MQTTVNERIKEIANALYKGNINELCRSCDIKQATMSNIVSGRMSKPSFEVLLAIVETTKVSSSWLLTGRGEMFPTAKAQPKEEPQPITVERLLAIIESQQRTIENLSSR